MKRILLCLVLCACQPVNKDIAIEPNISQTDSKDSLKECAASDKGSILWLDHFSNDVLGPMTDRYDAMSRICSQTKNYNGIKVTHPVFLYRTYESDMSNECKQTIKQFITELNEHVCN